MKKIKDKNKSFINKYDWNEINISLKAKDWKNFETNNKSVALYN